MNNYDALLDNADRLRQTGLSVMDFEYAIANYERYIFLGGPRKAHALQMSGVCYQRLHRDNDAVECYVDALSFASRDYEIGGIKRDLGEAYGKLGDYSFAQLYLNESLICLPAALYPQEHAATLGFIGRLEATKGNPTAASLYHHQADLILSAGPDRHNELYNKLSYASALDGARHPLQARAIAFKALRLSLRRDLVTGIRYGSRTHHVRALTLIVGGIALERTLAASSSRS